jgi:anti-sigma factor RsiW
MSLSRETLIELMALADGELEGDAKARAERLVASNDEARRTVDAMRGDGVRRWLRDSAGVRYEAARADDIAQGVMARLGASNVTAAAAARVPLRRVRPRPWIAAAGAALALAACLAIYVKSRSGSGEVAMHRAGESAGVDSVAADLRVAGGVEVDEIDAPTRGVSVFEIPVGGAAAAAGLSHPSSVVVWIDDEPGSR